jgi:hypothetical protein
MRASKAVGRLQAFLAHDAVQREQIDMNRLLDAATTFLRSEFVKHRITIVSNLDPGLPPVYGERVRIEQLVFSLLLDATDATCACAVEDRHLSLRTSVDGCCICIVLRNRLPRNIDHARWRERYGSEGGRTWFDSCAEIVRAHGGLVRAETSEDYASFRLSLPIQQRLETSPFVLGLRNDNDVGEPPASAQEEPSPWSTNAAATLADAHLELSLLRLRTAATMIYLAETDTDDATVRRCLRLANDILGAAGRHAQWRCASAALEAAIAERVDQLRERVGTVSRSLGKRRHTRERRFGRQVTATVVPRGGG